MEKYLFISGPEIMFILIVIVVVFGADKIPEIARNLAKGINYVKNATNDIKKEINQSVNKSNIKKDFSENIKKEIDDFKDSVDDLTGPIKREL